MTFLWALFAAIVWLGLWLAGAQVFLNRQHPPVDPERLQKIALPFIILSSSILAFAPAAGSRLPAILHHAGFAMLGAFMLASEYWRAQLRRGGPGASAAARPFFMAACIMAPLGAVPTLLSGWRMLHEGNHSLAGEAWLFWVFGSFSFFMFHGIFFWTAEAKRVALTLGRLSRWEEIVMSLHGVFYLAIFVIALNRPPLPHPAKALILFLEGLFPLRWAPVGAAVVLYVCIGVGVGLTYAFRRKAIRAQGGGS